MIRFIRDKFRGSIDRKYRKLQSSLARIGLEEKRLSKRKKKIVAQIMIIDALRGKRYGKAMPVL